MPKPNNAPQGRKSLMDNRVVSILMALACGLATWLVVTIYIDPQGSTTIRDVPINYAATTYTNQGLDIVERPDISGVTVRVEGNITSIGKMTSSDIMVYPSYSGVSGAGKVTLRLQARVTNTTDYSGNIKCTVEKPYDTIDVVFDEVSEKTVPVTVDASAVSIADGYMLNKTSAVPAEITLRGPTSELDQISQVVAPVLSDDAGRHHHHALHAGAAGRERQHHHPAVHHDGQRFRQRHADDLPGAGAAAGSGFHRRAQRL